jgi:perosamine synthetase
MNITIPVARPDLSGVEERYVLDAVRTSWISSTGSYVLRFEQEFADLCGTRSAVGTCNGTAALHLALLVLGVRPGDEVIVPSLTYIATANAVRYVGAEPVFVDVDPGTWCLDPTKMEAAVTRRTRGVIAVHLYGHPANMDAINRIAAVNGLWVVEDAAEAPLARYKGRLVGGLGTVAAFSFYGNKIFTCGEGGALTLNDASLDFRARLLRGQGMDPARRYYFPVTGYNYRLTNVCCAMLCGQLERREIIMRRRMEIYARYRQLLEGVPGLGFQPVAQWAQISPWLFSITIDAQRYGRTRDQVMAGLTNQGIDSRPFFVAVHTLPPFREESQQRREHLPITDELANAGLNLPTFSTMTDEEVQRVADALRNMKT